MKWYKYQTTCIRENKIITKDQKRRFLLINDNFEGPSNRKEWIKIYDKLVEFRKNNLDRWPQARRDRNYSSDEVELGIWCQTLRERFRNGELTNYWFEKMIEIGFNFEGKTDNWTQYWQEINNLLEGRKSISIEEIGQNAYLWILRHRRKYEEGTLSDYQHKKIKDLNLDRFYETWEQKLEKIRDWIEQTRKLPTRTTQKDFHSWLASQRVIYKNNRLTNEQIQALRSIGYDLEARGKEKNEQKWLEYFIKLKFFIEKNGRYPGPTKEKDLYIWVQAQRAVKAGNAKNRNPLSKEREDLLNSIDFIWVGDTGGVAEKSWDENFDEFRVNIDNFGRLNIPVRLGENMNPTYTWWINQKNLYKKKELSKERIEKFKSVGIDLAITALTIKKDGFTKWANKIYEIADFIKKHNKLPRASGDSNESKLYQSLSRTKRSFKKNQLSAKQLNLLSELNIKFD